MTNVPKAIMLGLLEAEDQPDPDDFDMREWILAIPGIGIRRIRTSYTDTWWPEGREDYEQESGWDDEEGVDMTLDKWDQEDGLTNVTKAIKWLKDKGATDTGNDDWYSSEPEENYRNGHSKEYNYHLYGYTDEELAEIYAQVTRPRRRLGESAAPDMVVIEPGEPGV